MADDGDAAEPEPRWVRNTRITAEAARVALATGKTALERFAIFEKLIASAVESPKPAISGAQDNAETGSACPLVKSPYDDVAAADSDLSGFEGVEDRSRHEQC